MRPDMLAEFDVVRSVIPESQDSTSRGLTHSSQAPFSSQQYTESHPGTKDYLYRIGCWQWILVWTSNFVL